MNILQLILASVGSISAFVLSKEFFILQIVRLINWMKSEKEHSEDRSIDVGEEISKLKLTEVERYEKTFETLLNQIEDLEQQLKIRLILHLSFGLSRWELYVVPTFIV